ncbi:TetR/AcrR family transcriptional regulator [Sulfurimonas sp. HSL-3221]|uniref:TetR/AcrR family transcriptional regulator n=1 Tax=Sulfurimonadaceae TaxID=2771471 RepID=UPI001E5D9BE5|nr:TetR/AcrR family transcriptional regulator [Sulfurimonas sp. HSL-3221]UFS61347.1 TetR/AcrR family transcriptional regulator [Sulfurimonas sp. HSL-3221]
MPENREFKKGGDTKKLIEEAAMDLFAEYGYKGASVRKIAAKVGIRESALYNHYANKEAIFLAVAGRVFASPFAHQKTDDFVQQNAKKGKSFLHKFMTEFKLMTFDKKYEKLFRFMLIELMQNDVLRSGFRQEFHDANIKLLSSGFFIMMQEGLIRSNDPMTLANAFLGQLFYLRLQVSLLKADGVATTALSTAFEKQLDLFWTSISE